MLTVGRERTAAEATGTRLRPVPYPYAAILAICSDLDLTVDAAAYFDSARFLNTTESTPMGRGVGLEVGNTIYFDMSPNQFAYWNADEADRGRTRALIDSGHIDCLHSFGDHATSRRHAARALDELARHGCSLGVWIDHAVAPTNFGADIMRGTGDVPGAEAYHADLTLPFGVQYVWRGRVTSVLGQNVPRSVAPVVTGAHPVASLRTAAVEAAKGALAAAGHAKYAMHGDNRILRRASLRDGQPILEFMRANPYWGGVSAADTGDGLGDVLTERMLAQLTRRGGMTILYTHLGKSSTPHEPFSDRTRTALRRLARAQADGQVLVTTTRRLLDFCAASETAAVTVRTEDGAEHIDVSLAADRFGRPTGVADGLTFYVDDARRVAVSVNGRPVEGLVRNPADRSGKPSVSVPWRRLAFPDLGARSSR